MASGTTTTFETAGSGPKRWAMDLATDARRGEILPILNALHLARIHGRFDDRAFLAAVVGPACPTDLLQRACELMPRASEPCILHAAGLLDSARSEGELHIAIAQLETAAALDDDDPTPWALRVGIAVARGAPADGRKAFKAAMARDRHNHYAHRAMVRLLSQRHHGSHSQALQAARTAASIAEAGSDLHGCLFEAHAEVWRSMRAEDESAAAGYLESDFVRYELEVAFDAWLVRDYHVRLGSGPALGAAALWYFHTNDTHRLCHVRSIIRDAPALRAA